MAGRCSLDSYYEIPHTISSENQVEERPKGPPAAGTLESSMLDAKRCGDPTGAYYSERANRSQPLCLACGWLSSL